MHQLRKVSNNKGFTLVELLVAIAIIATLTAILLPNFMGAREKAKDSKLKSDMVAMKNALRMYYNDKQSYPGSRAIWEGVLPTYAPQMVSSAIGESYAYVQTNGGDGFMLCADLESASGTEVADSQARCAVSNQICNGDDTLKIIDPNDTAMKSRYVVCAN